MHHRPYQKKRGKRKEERGKRKEERGKRKVKSRRGVLAFARTSENKYHYSLFTIHSFLSSLFYEPSYMRESKAYRRGAKSAINYVHLLN